MSPMLYLTRWRMLLAGHRLREGGETVSAIAHAVGYESEAAFSTAFRRIKGRSPRQHGDAPGSGISMDLWGDAASDG